LADALASASGDGAGKKVNGASADAAISKDQNRK
jgi:hypothetical protein